MVLLFHFQHDCQEFLALLLDSLHEELNFKSNSTNQNKESLPSTSKQPITFEHNINNRISAQSSSKVDFADDKSRNATTPHSSLTFDNMIDSKTNLSVKSLKGKECGKVKVEGCKSAPSLIPFTVNQISEDSNHSSISEHSSDSEQCSVMKNLKLRSSPTATASSLSIETKLTNGCGSKDCAVSSSYDLITDSEMMTEEGNRTERFKRVHSLQDFREKCDSGVLSKASSDLDLVSKASDDIDVEISGDIEPIGKLESRENQKEKTNVIGEDSMDESAGEPVLLNNAISTTSVPSLQDLYSKETKTLNTNVLATEFIIDTVTTDSDKFAKHDNTSERVEVIDEEDILQNVHEVTSKGNGFETKRIKDVNIRADKKSKSPKGTCASTSMMSMEKDDCFALNSVKRMKFEGTEKNLQMQEICKIQKEALLRDAMHMNKPGSSNITIFRKDASPSVESDIDSDMVEDIDHEGEMDVSDDNDGEEGVVRRQNLDNSGLYTDSEVIAAEEAWQKYHSKNDSVIVDTFQGQFKSTVSAAEIIKSSLKTNINYVLVINNKKECFEAE